MNPSKSTLSSLELARELHEAGRAAVERGHTVAHAVHKTENARKFIEWDDLGAEAQMGRVLQAEALLEKFAVYDIRKLEANVMETLGKLFNDDSSSKGVRS